MNTTYPSDCLSLSFQFNYHTIYWTPHQLLIYLQCMLSQVCIYLWTDFFFNSAFFGSFIINKPTFFFFFITRAFYKYSWPLNSMGFRGTDPPGSQTSAYNFWLPWTSQLIAHWTLQFKPVLSKGQLYWLMMMGIQHSPRVMCKDSRCKQLGSKPSYTVNHLHNLEEVKICNSLCVYEKKNWVNNCTT